MAENEAETPGAIATRELDDVIARLKPMSPVSQEWLEAAKLISTRYLTARRERDPIATAAGHLGRKSFIADPDATSRLLQAIEDGLTYDQACKSIGISVAAYNLVRDTAERHEREGVESAHRAIMAVAQIARERRRQGLMNGIRAAGNAGPQHWTAYAWLLERGYGGDYKLQAQQVTGGVVVNVGIAAGSDVRIGIGLLPPESATHNAPLDAPIDVTPTVVTT